jgi:hypothetical protein
VISTCVFFLEAERLFLIFVCCLDMAARSHSSALAPLLQGSEGDVFKVAALEKSGKWREFAAKVEKMLPDGTYRDNLKGEVKPRNPTVKPPAIRRPPKFTHHGEFHWRQSARFLSIRSRDSPPATLHPARD